MTDTSLATIEPPSNRQLARREASAPLRVTGKLKAACDALALQGLPMDQAAQSAGLPTRRLRLALSKPHVIAYLKAQRDVLRTSMCGKNILRLAEIRDAADNMPAVQAIRELERLPEDNASANKHLMPGFVVQIVNVQQVADVPKQSVQVIDKA